MFQSPVTFFIMHENHAQVVALIYTTQLASQAIRQYITYHKYISQIGPNDTSGRKPYTYQTTQTVPSVKL